MFTIRYKSVECDGFVASDEYMGIFRLFLYEGCWFPSCQNMEQNCNVTRSSRKNFPTSTTIYMTHYRELINLFVVCLMTLSVSQTIQHRMIGWLMNWKGCGRKRSWPNWMYYPYICLEWLREHKKYFNQDNRSLGRDSKQRPPEYEAGMLTTRPRRPELHGIN
jgi:hypothetical protein